MGKVTITAVFTAPPSSPTVAFTDLLFDKRLGICLTKDDSGIGDYNIVYPSIKGTPVVGGETYPAKTYTDGAGVSRFVGYTFASNGTPNHSDGNPTITQWSQYREILEDENFTIANHSRDHSNEPSAEFQLQANEPIIKGELGVDMRTVVLPTGLPGFVQGGIDLGYIAWSSEGYGSSPGSGDPETDSSDGYSADINWNSRCDVRTLADKYLILTRYNFDGSWTSGTIAAAKAVVDEWFTAAEDDSKRYVFSAFSHGPSGATEAIYFNELLQYMLDHPDNDDNVWFPNLQEFAEWIEIKRTAVISVLDIVGNEVTFEIDLDDLPAKSFYHNMSIKITGGTLESISVDGADNQSFTADGLINIYKTGEQAITPYEILVPHARYTISAPAPAELWRDYFDHAYFATSALNDSSQPVSPTEQVNTIPDELGSLDMTYIGAANPLLTDAKPRYYSELGGYVFLPNEANVKYRSDVGDTGLGFPRERWYLGVLSNYQLFEAFFNMFGAEYVGDLQQSATRIRNGTEFSGDESYLVNVPTPLNKVFLIRQQFIDERPVIPEAGGADLSYLLKCNMWINGVFVGKVMSTLKIPAHQHSIAVGADTNNSHWGFMAMFWKDGVLNDLEAAAFLSELSLMYNFGDALTLPYADLMNIARVGDSITASYTFKSVDGISENIGARKVKWVLMPDGSPTTAYYMPELDGLLTFNKSDYPQYNFDINSVRVEITVQDEQGRRFNIPQSLISNF